MKKFVVVFLSVFVVLIAGLIALPFFVPKSTYRNVIETQLETELGREVTFESDPEIRVFPQFGVKFEGVTIANADGFESPYFAKAESMAVSVKWFPLLSKRVEIAAANFTGTEVLLEEDRKGNQNWIFGTPEAAASADKKATTSSSGFSAEIPKARLSKSRIRFTSAAKDLTYDVKDIDLTASMTGAEGEVKLVGGLTINDQPLQINARLDSLDQLMAQKPFSIEADIQSDLADAGFDGKLTIADTVTLDGKFDTKLKDLKGIADLANAKLENDISGLGTISTSGKVSGTPNRLALSSLKVDQSGKWLTSHFAGNATIAKTLGVNGELSVKSSELKALAKAFDVVLEGADSSAYKSLDAQLALTDVKGGFKADISKLQFDAISATGSATLLTNKSVPYIAADLSIPKLDLSPYLTETESGQQKGDPTDGWSDDSLDLSALKSLNGDFTLAIGSLSNDRAELLDVRFNGQLKNGSLSGTLVSSEPDGGRTGKPGKLNPLYNGDLTTDFTITSTSATANTLKFDASGSGIAAADLVKFLTGQNVLSGIASLDMSASTSGASVADFVHNLAGDYKADVADGAIFGINLPQLIRSASEALTSGKLPKALSPESQTDFSSLNVQGDLNNGVAEIELFQLLSPYVRADATGTVDLFNQTLDIRIRPRAVTSGTGQGGDTTLAGIGIPLRVKGSWSKISGSLDMDYFSTLVADEAKSKLTDKLNKQLGNSVNEKLGGSLGGLLGDALGTGKPSPSSNTPKSEPDTTEEPAESEKTEEEEEQDPEDVAKDLLKDLIFGKKKD